MNKILIVKTSALGDIIHVFPVVEYLRKKFPSAQIDWIVEAPFAELVRSHPFVDNVLTVETKAWRKKPLSSETWKSIRSFRSKLRKVDYDAVFDLQGNAKSGLIVSQVRSSVKVGFGKKSVPEWPNMLFTNRRINPSPQENIRQDYIALVAEFFGDSIQHVNGNVKLAVTEEQAALVERIIATNAAGQQSTVMVCPGSAWKNKRLTPETLKAFLSLLNNDLGCRFLFIWGSPEEKALADELQLVFAGNSQVVDRMSLPMLQNLMERCDLVVAMDSLPLHLAGTTKTPSFSVFGASSALKYKPLGEQHYAMQGSCPYDRTFVKRCPILRTCPTGACIRDLKAAEIFGAFKSWWEAAKRL